jgi:hypothetical protein
MSFPYPDDRAVSAPALIAPESEAPDTQNYDLLVLIN